MDQPYLDYLSLLQDVEKSLSHLTELSHQKMHAMGQNDLIALDEVLKQEQAMTLTLRGYEQKRSKLLKELGLEKVPLQSLDTHYPPHLQAQAKQTAQSLRESYQTFHQSWDVARNAMEHNLHEIEQIIKTMGGDPSHGAGYGEKDIEPPKNMKTDFRA